MPISHNRAERTLRFVQKALALSRYHDGNPGEALAGVGQRLGICYYCWDRGHDLRQGICSDCRAADAIGIAPGEAAHRPPDKAAISHAFIREETVRELLRLLPEQLTTDLDIGALRKLPGSCVDLGQDVREIWVDSPWSVDYPAGQAEALGDAGTDDRDVVASVPESGEPPPPLRIDAVRKLVPFGKRRGRATVDLARASVQRSPPWTPTLDRSGMEQVRVHVRRRAAACVPKRVGHAA